MKLTVLILTLCALAAAVPKWDKHEIFVTNGLANESPEGHNAVINALIRQLFEFIRHLITHGSDAFNIPPLDPLEFDHFHLEIPAGLINLSLELKKVKAIGLSKFMVHKSNLDLRDLTFDVELSLPTMDISAEDYDMVGDLFGAIPLYGKGKANFKIDDFRFRSVIYLKQSEDGRSILIDRFENTNFVIPKLKCELTGAIGGGDIDAIVNAFIEDVIVDYINRFQSPIGAISTRTAIALLNPILDQLDTWRYIDRLIPRG